MLSDSKQNIIFNGFFNFRSISKAFGRCLRKNTNCGRNLLVQKSFDKVNIFSNQQRYCRNRSENIICRHQGRQIVFDEGQTLKCQKCKRKQKYKATTGKTYHVGTHQGLNNIKTFECIYCPFRTITKYRLEKHEVSHKTFNEVQTFKCQQCSYETKYKRNLKIHEVCHKTVEEVHTFKCQKCLYVTKYRHHLTYHLETHKNLNEVSTFKCTECSFETRHKRNLKAHEVCHKNINDMQAFKCHDCSFKTKHKRSLTRHKQSHII